MNANIRTRLERGALALAIVGVVGVGIWALLQRPERLLDAELVRYRFRVEAKAGTAQSERVAQAAAAASTQPSRITLNDLAQAHLSQAKRTLNSESFDRAEAAALASLKLANEDNAPAQLVLAQVMLARHEFEAALALIAQHENELGEAAVPVKITALIAIGRNAEAERTARALAVALPTAAAMLQLGLTVEAQGRYREALDLYYEALRAEDVGEASTSSWCRALVGRVLYNLGHFDEAQIALTEALRIDADQALATDFMGRTLLASGREAKAEKFYQGAADRLKDPAFFIALAVTKRMRGKTDEAKVLLDLVSANLNEDLRAGRYGHRADLARVKFEYGDASALTAARELLEEEWKTRQSSLVLVLLMQAARRLNDNEMGARWARIALERYPQHPLVKYLAGTRLGDAALIASARADNRDIARLAELNL